MNGKQQGPAPFIPLQPQIGIVRGRLGGPAWRWSPSGIKPLKSPTATQAFQNQMGALGVNKFPAVDDAVDRMRNRQTGNYSWQGS